MNSPTASQKNARLQLRVDAQSKLKLERAARYAGTSVSEFVLRNALSAAERVLETHEAIVLSETDWTVFYQALLEPPRPQPALLDLLREHHERVRWMAVPARLDIRPLDGMHERDEFACGEPTLDRYLKAQASQDRRRHLAQTFCATFIDTQRVIGFYALSAASVQKERLPPPLAKKLPYYPIPAAILGRLATDRAVRGQGIGRLLVADAILRTLNASQAMGIYGLLIDAKHEQAKAFYERLGFVPLVDAPLRLILPLQTALAAVADINPQQPVR